MVDEGVIETKLTELKEAFYFLSDTITKVSESAKQIPEISGNLNDIKSGIEQLLSASGKVPEGKKEDLMQKIQDLNTTLELLKGNQENFTGLVDSNTRIIQEISQLKESIDEVKKSSNTSLQENLQEITDKIKEIQDYSNSLRVVVDKLNRIDSHTNYTSTPSETTSESSQPIQTVQTENLKPLLQEINEKIGLLQDVKNTLDNLIQGTAKDHDQLFQKIEALTLKQNTVDPTVITSGNTTDKHEIILKKLDEIKEQTNEANVQGLKNSLELLANQISKLNQNEVQTDVETVKKLHETTSSLLQDLKNSNFDPTKFDLNNTQVIDLLKDKFDVTGQALKIIYEKQKELGDKLQENQELHSNTNTTTESHSEALDQIMSMTNEVKQTLSQQKIMLQEQQNKLEELKTISEKPKENQEDSKVTNAVTLMAQNFDQIITDVKNDSRFLQENIGKMKDEVELNNAKLLVALEDVKKYTDSQKTIQSQENDLNQTMQRLEKHYEQTNSILNQLSKANQEIEANFNTKLELLNNNLQANFKALESEAKLQKTNTDTLIQILIKLSENIDGINRKLIK